MQDAPVGALYSAGMYTVERLAALCAIANPMLALNCAKVLSRQGDHFGAASVVLAMGSRNSREGSHGSDDVHAIIVWALQELVPKLGMESFEPVLQSLQPDKMSPQVLEPHLTLSSSGVSRIHAQRALSILTLLLEWCGCVVSCESLCYAEMYVLTCCWLASRSGIPDADAGCQRAAASK